MENYQQMDTEEFREYAQGLKQALFGCPYSRIMEKNVQHFSDFYLAGKIICTKSILDTKLHELFDADCEIRSLKQNSDGKLEGACSWNGSGFLLDVENFKFKNSNKN